TDRETTMEDTHVWVVNADGSGRREFATIDNRQGAPVWGGDGRAIYFTAQERGSVHLYRQAVDSAKAEKIIDGAVSVGSESVAKSGAMAYVLSTPSDMGELFVHGVSAGAGGSAKQITELNKEVLA